MTYRARVIRTALDGSVWIRGGRALANGTELALQPRQVAVTGLVAGDGVIVVLIEGRLTDPVVLARTLEV